LGVLKQPAGAVGAVRFSPALPEKEEALGGVEMGNVVKVVLRFREPFWEGILADAPARTGTAAAADTATAQRGRRRRGASSTLGFLRAPEEAIPTWWTQAPVPGSEAPLLTGWLGGPNAERLAALGADGLRALSLETVGRIFGMGRERVEALLVSWHYHDWRDDPFARGAYAYVGVNGLAAQETLAAPVAGTLFFAGEATEWHGHFSTVHGAIMTGRRAAREVMSNG
jgi:monoamine oxidase